MKKFGLGLVGCGTIAFARDGYLPGLAFLKERVELVAVCDLLPQRARKAADEYGASRCYSNVEEMLADEAIDILLNLTPIPLHGEINLKAVEAGKHLISEKPLGSSMETAQAILKTTRERNLKATCAPLEALLPHIQKVRQFIQEGRIGQVCFARVHSSHAGPAAVPFWPTDPAWYYHQGAGSLLDMGVYGLTQITTILGPAKRVTAFTGITELEREIAWGPRLGEKIKVDEIDNSLVLLDFGSSLFAVVDGSYNMISAKGPGLEFYGRKGVINIYQPWLEPGAPLYQLYSLAEQAQPPIWESPGLAEVTASLSRIHQLARATLIEHLADCIAQDRQPLVSLEQAMHVLEIMLKATQSSQAGRTLELETAFPFCV